MTTIAVSELVDVGTLSIVSSLSASQSSFP
jgi:hypothetical protein